MAMKLKPKRIFFVTLLTLSMSTSIFAGELDEAAKQAAKKNNAKVLSAKTVKRGGGKTHEIKLLTNKGVVKTVKVPSSNKKKKD
jgi:Mor family transcriptional regulator